MILFSLKIVADPMDDCLADAPNKARAQIGWGWFSYLHPDYDDWVSFYRIQCLPPLTQGPIITDEDFLTNN